MLCVLVPSFQYTARSIVYPDSGHSSSLLFDARLNFQTYVNTVVQSPRDHGEQALLKPWQLAWKHELMVNPYTDKLLLIINHIIVELKPCLFCASESMIIISVLRLYQTTNIAFLIKINTLTYWENTALIVLGM